MTQKIKKRLALSLILVLFFLIYFKFADQKIFSIQFGDEEAEIIVGQWFLSGKRIYQDIFYNHQPIPFIISSIIQNVTKPNSIFLLIKRHREIMMLYSAFWSLFLLWRFGAAAFFFTIFYELTKFTLLGNLFSAESLVVPPIIFLTGIVYFLVYKKKQPVNNLDLIIAIGCLLFIQFTLLPMAPFVIFIFIFLWKFLEKKQKKILLIVFTFILILLLIYWNKISLNSYIKDTFLFNLSSSVSEEIAKQSWLFFFIRIVFLPALIFFESPSGGFYLIVKVISFWYLLSIFFLVKKQKFNLLLVLILLNILVNFRSQPLGLFYSGFHLLPWYAVLLWMTVLNTASFLFKVKIIQILFFASLVILILPFGSRELLRKNNQYNDWYINYSAYFDFGEAVRLLADKNDTLLTIPGFPLIYWQSGLYSNSPYFFMYDFMYKNNKLVKEISSYWEHKPPDFLYIYESDYAKFSEVFKDYVAILRDNKPSRLFVKKEKLAEISDDNWLKVARYAFSKPSLDFGVK